MAAPPRDPFGSRRSPAGSRTAAAGRPSRRAMPARRAPPRSCGSPSAAPSVSASGFSWLTTSTSRARCGSGLRPRPGRRPARSTGASRSRSAALPGSAPAAAGRCASAASRRAPVPAVARLRARRLRGAAARPASAGPRRTPRPSAGSAPDSSSERSRSTRVPRSSVSSRRTWSSGIRLIRRRAPSSWRMNGIARPSAAIAASRSAGVPITLTQTLAWRRSGSVSTSVIVAKPIRGSPDLTGEQLPDLLAEQLVDPVSALGHGSSEPVRRSDATLRTPGIGSPSAT